MSTIDWPTCADPLAMLEDLFPVRGVDSVEPQSRKSRLYLLACARRAWGELPGVCRAVVAVAERVYKRRVPDRRLRDEVYPHAEALVHCRGEAADVNAIGRELVRLGCAAADVRTDADVPADRWTGYAHLAFYPFYKPTPNFGRIPARLHSADLLREVFGNPPTRAAPLNRAWLTEDVVRIAQNADANADFASLPILADALQDAGCDRSDVLDHFRDANAAHVRGCWALELILDPR
jgi:hypothetical protein